MALAIEDYALIGDTQSAALVGKNGSIDWLCWPRFDSGALFAALLGEARHGHFSLAPLSHPRGVVRRYRHDTLILETEFTVESGSVTLVDFMPVRGSHADLVRIVVGVRGRVPMRLSLLPRFGYGHHTPWFARQGYAYSALAGPDALRFHADVPLEIEQGALSSEFVVEAGQRLVFAMTWHPSHEPPPKPIDAEAALEHTERFWHHWTEHASCRGPYREAMMRSLITLKALTYSPTGGIVAAVTTSLPEHIGGVRNWDYRFCWVRDATMTLFSLMNAGYLSEARAWRDWLVRAVAGNPSEFQIMYGVAGERHLPELDLPWLPGYEGSRPVRVGNAAYSQFQLDVWGEVMDCLHHGRRAGIGTTEQAWEVQRALVASLSGVWREADEGIWETRGPRQHFTHSKIMAWVAVDRAIKAVEHFQLPGPLSDWKRLRVEIHADVCEHGYDEQRGTFTQAYGSKGLDASLLRIPVLGFLPASDPRVRSTVLAIRRELCDGGYVHRYDTRLTEDGLPAGEGVFLACSFWLVDALALMGERQEAVAIFEELLGLRNDVGLLSEEYDPSTRRFLGNFPQAFSHISLLNTAVRLTGTDPKGTHPF